jgi:ABC-type tungstate transport system substrate-binding protein
MRFVRYLITGGSGYIGGRLTDELAGRDETEKIVDVDLRPPGGRPSIARQALGMVGRVDIVALSLGVSLSSVALTCLFALPLGAALAVADFPGRATIVTTLNALLGLPAVVVGLAVYLLLSRSGPLGAWGILFTPAAMVLAQTILVLPVVAALSRQLVTDGLRDAADPLRSMGAGPRSTFSRLALG